jgi:5'-nucleotidase
MDVLLTNDDGIDAVGIRTLCEGLDEVADVTVVAPADDQSAVGRQLSRDVRVRETDFGYAVAGTPADCVVAGLSALDLAPDLVVAGCNRGANLGEYVLGRSGTVSAAVEAAFFGVPAIAASVYFPAGDTRFAEFTAEAEHFRECVRAVRHLVGRAPEAGVFEDADYLNVNAPLPPERGRAGMVVTEPSHVYEMEAVREGETVSIRDRIWERMAEGDVPDPHGSDRRAVLDGNVSVSPLTVPHTTTTHEALDDLAAAYEG